MQIKERNIIIYTFLKLVAIYLYTACMENISYLIIIINNNIYAAATIIVTVLVIIITLITSAVHIVGILLRLI